MEEKSGLGLGCMSVSGQYDNGVPLSPDAAVHLFKGVYDAGCRHFDTAEVYRGGSGSQASTPGSNAETVYNESQLGKFFSTVSRDSFTIGTKYAPWEHGGKADYATVKSALLASLKRLGLSFVDLYYTHRVMSREYAIEFTQSVRKLVEEGLVRNIGLSEVSAAWLRAAHAEHPICCVQMEWSLLTRGIEDEMVPACRELGVGIVAYSPLARNLLTAPKERPTDVRRSGLPRFNEDNFEKNQSMLARLEALATEKSVSPAQLSMAWLLQKSVDLGVSCMPIPGTNKLPHALDNLASTKVKLAPKDMTLLEDIASMTAGARENDGYLKTALEGVTERSKL